MKLDRNINPDGEGKYALIKMRGVSVVGKVDVNGVECAAIPIEFIDSGNTPDSEFFVIRLKDKHAAPALYAYAAHAMIEGDTEWGQEVLELANKAANHPSKRKPD